MLDQILRVPLLPLLIAQGVWVRARAVFLPEPAGERSGTFGDGPALRVLVVGDSSAAGVGADRQKDAMPACLATALSKDHSVTYRLEAVTGATTESAAQSLAGLETNSFDIGLIVLGVNDVTSVTSPADYLWRLRAIETEMQDRFSIRHVVYSGVPPMRHFPLLPQPLRWVLGMHAERLDTALAAFACASPARSHLPLDLPFDPDMVARDGYHPSPQAHTLWANMLADHIRGVVGQMT